MLIRKEIFDNDLAQNYILVHNVPKDINFEEQEQQPFDILQGIQKLKQKRELLTEIMNNYAKSYGVNFSNSQSLSSKQRFSESLINSFENEDNPCCSLAKNKLKCICGYTLYKVRPYVYELLRALQPFFEIIALSNMPQYELEQIVDHIESVLNKPIAELIIK